MLTRCLRFAVMTLLLTTLGPVPPSGAASHADCMRVPRCRQKLAAAQKLAEHAAYEAALAQYERLIGEYKDLRLTYNAARMLHHLSRFREAVLRYDDFLREGGELERNRIQRAMDYRRDAAHQALERELAALTLAPPAVLPPSRRASYSVVLPDLATGEVFHATRHPLQTPPPPYTRWWFWGAAGLLVSAAGIAVGITVYAHPPSCVAPACMELPP